MMLVQRLGLSPLTLLGITGVVILTFCSLMMVTKILAGDEIIVYYRHEISVAAMTALFLRLIGQPVLPYLDITVLGIGLFLACGRIGCLMVGCCHGRPWHWGVRYSDEHAHAGFPEYLVGVKLFPIQAVESIFALCVVAFGMVLVIKGYPPGSALVFYVVGYGWGRFCIEFARGDTLRRYLWGFSEAQWTSLLLGLAVIAGERAKVLPASTWHGAAAIAMGASMVLIGIWRHLDDSHQFELLHPRHVREIIGALDQLERSTQQAKPDSESSRCAVGIHLARTSLGYRISAGQSVVGSCTLRHYSVSKDSGSLSPRAAQILSHLIARLEETPDSFKLIRGNEGVFHILFDSSSDCRQPRAQYPENLAARRQLTRRAM